MTGDEENLAPEGEARTEVEKTEAKSQTVEDLAQDMGWSPKDKWRGDPAQWKDAASFVKSTVEINKRISSELRETKDEVKRIARASAAIADQAIAKREAQLKAEFEASVKAGDVQGAARARDELQQVRSEPQTNPLDDFKSRNGWYGSDDDATDYAFALANRLAGEGKDVPTQLKIVEEKVRKKFPALFGAVEEPAQPKGKAPALVAETQSRAAAPRSKVKGVADLPADAKKAGEDFVKRGRVENLEEYAKTYWQEIA